MPKTGEILPHRSFGKTTFMFGLKYRPIPQSSVSSLHHTPIRIQPRFANC